MAAWLSIPLEHYYDGELEVSGIPVGVDVKDSSFRTKLMINESNLGPSLERIMHGHGRLWLVQSRADSVDKDGLVMTRLNQTHELLETRDFGSGLKLYLYDIV